MQQRSKGYLVDLCIYQPTSHALTPLTKTKTSPASTLPSYKEPPAHSDHRSAAHLRSYPLRFSIQYLTSAHSRPYGISSRPAPEVGVPEIVAAIVLPHKLPRRNRWQRCLDARDRLAGSFWIKRGGTGFPSKYIRRCGAVDAYHARHICLGLLYSIILIHEPILISEPAGDREENFVFEAFRSGAHLNAVGVWICFKTQ